MNTFKGIIFDFNGVLWWDGHLQEQAWKEFSAMLRGSPFSDEEMAYHVHGRNNRHTLEYLTGNRLNLNSLQHLTQKKETIYRQLCLDQGSDFRLSPGDSISGIQAANAAGIGHIIALNPEKMPWRG